MHVKLVWPFIHLKSKRPQFGNNFSDNFFRQSNICSGILLHLKLHRSDWYSCQVPTHFYHIWRNLFLMCSFTTVWKTFDGACFRLLGRWENTLLLRTQSNLSKTVLEIFGLPTQLSTPQKTLYTFYFFGCAGRRRQCRKDEAEIRKRVFGYRELYRHGWRLVVGAVGAWRDLQLVPQKPPRPRLQL